MARILSFLSCLIVAATVFAGVALALEPLDTSKLPRLAGGDAKDTYATVDTTIFTAPGSVNEVASGVAALLAANGWQQYGRGVASSEPDEPLQIQNFKKGPYSISAYTSVAPALDGRTSVQYSQEPMTYDLPFPADATDIGFEHRDPLLICRTGMTIAAAHEFFTREMGARGYAPYAGPGAATADDVANKKSLRSHFLKDKDNPLLLALVAGDDGRTQVHLKATPIGDMTAEYAKPAPAAAPAALPAAPQPPAETRDVATDEKASEAEFWKMAQDLVREAQKPVAKKPKEKLEDQPIEALAVMANAGTRLPLPEGAKEIEIDAAEGDVEFSSRANVASVAAFYRREMSAQGWKEKKSVINSATMVAMNFAKNGKDISLTLMRMGDDTDVDADGSGLVDEAAAKVEAERQAEANAPPQLTDADLKVADAGGLPIPEPYSYKGNTKSAFFVEANALVSASVETLLTFYRRELGKLGWKEESGAAVAANAATVAFTAADGPATLKLERKDGQTSVALKLRKKAEAEKSGYMPKPGQVKIMFGNTEESDAQVTVDKQTVKLKPGEGASKTPNGPAIEVAPGAHKITVKMKGKPAKTEEATFGPDEIWGVLVGPGGALPLPMY